MLDHTPLFNCLDESQMLTGPDYDLHNGPLFPAAVEWDDAREVVTQSKSESLPTVDVSWLAMPTGVCFTFLGIIVGPWYSLLFSGVDQG